MLSHDSSPSHASRFDWRATLVEDVGRSLFQKYRYQLDIDLPASVRSRGLLSERISSHWSHNHWTSIYPTSLLLFRRDASLQIHLRKTAIHCHRSSSQIFNITPQGRILQRFTGDMAVVDDELPSNTMGFLAHTLSLITYLGVCLFIVPGFLVPSLLLLFAGPWIVNGFLAATRGASCQLTAVARLSECSFFLLLYRYATD